MSWLATFWRPQATSWRQRLDGLNALPKAKPPRVCYEQPDSRIRPKVRNFREWVDRYEREKVS